MVIREAGVRDIQQIQVIRNSVKENTLSDPSLVTDENCKEFMTVRGKGWVAEIDLQIVGFAIIDLKENNIWALFVLPDFVRKIPKIQKTVAGTENKKLLNFREQFLR